MKNYEGNFSETPDLLERAMQSPAAWPAQSGDVPTALQIIRWRNNALSHEELHELQDLFNTSDEACAKLDNVTAQLKILKLLSVPEIRQKADDKEIAETAQAWLAFIGEHAGKLTRSPRHTLIWENLQKKAAESVGEAQTGWAAFMAFGEQLRAAFHMRTLEGSPARGNSKWEKIDILGLPDAIAAHAQAVVEKNNNLRASLELKDEKGHPSAEWDGQSLRLALTLNGVTLPVTDAVVVNGSAEWNASGLGEVLKLQEKSSIPRTYLQITRSEDESPVFAGKRILYAQIFNNNGTMEGNPPIAVELLSEPVVEDGSLCLKFNITAEERIAYMEYDLLVEIGVTADHWQLLDRLPLAQWEAGGYLLKIPWSAAVSDPAGLSALLRVRLIPSVV